MIFTRGMLTNNAWNAFGIKSKMEGKLKNFALKEKPREPRNWKKNIWMFKSLLSGTLPGSSGPVDDQQTKKNWITNKSQPVPQFLGYYCCDLWCGRVFNHKIQG